MEIKHKDRQGIFRWKKIYLEASFCFCLLLQLSSERSILAHSIKLAKRSMNSLLLVYSWESANSSKAFKKILTTHFFYFGPNVLTRSLAERHHLMAGRQPSAAVSMKDHSAFPSGPHIVVDHFADFSLCQFRIWQSCKSISFIVGHFVDFSTEQKIPKQESYLVKIGFTVKSRQSGLKT